MKTHQIYLSLSAVLLAIAIVHLLQNKAGDLPAMIIHPADWQVLAIDGNEDIYATDTMLWYNDENPAYADSLRYMTRASLCPTGSHKLTFKSPNGDVFDTVLKIKSGDLINGYELIHSFDLQSKPKLQKSDSGLADSFVKMNFEKGKKLSIEIDTRGCFYFAYSLAEYSVMDDGSIMCTWHYEKEMEDRMAYTRRLPASYLDSLIQREFEIIRKTSAPRSLVISKEGKKLTAIILSGFSTTRTEHIYKIGEKTRTYNY